MSAPTFLGRSGPLSYYYIAGANTPINIDPRVTVKAFLISSGGAVTELELTDRSIYMLSQVGTVSLYNSNSQIARVSGNGGGIVLANYTNIPSITTPSPLDSSMILAISPGVPPSTSEVSMAGLGLDPVSTQNGKKYYIVKTDGIIRFNTTRSKTLYYVGAGGQGGTSSRSGTSLRIGGQRYFHAGIPYDPYEDGSIPLSDAGCLGGQGKKALTVNNAYGGNTYIQGGGAGAGGGGGGGAGAVGKIVVTSNYLNCNISSTGTVLYTEDRYLGIARPGAPGSASSFISSMDSYQDGSNPPNSIGGNRLGGDYYGGTNVPVGGLGSTGGIGGTVINAYTGTTIINGGTGGWGGDGGGGEGQGFKAEQPGFFPPPGVVQSEAQPGASFGNVTYVGIFNQTMVGGQPTGPGGSVIPEVCKIYWNIAYNVGQRVFKNPYETVDGRNGGSGAVSKGFGSGNGGQGGLGGQGVGTTFTGSLSYCRTQVFARGGGGGGGGNGAPGFSLDGAERTTGLDALGDTNGCVIIVLG